MQQETSCPCKRIPLHLSSFTAAEHGNLPALRLRLSTKLSQPLLLTPTYDSAGNTPLHFAAQHGHTELVAVLLGTGVYNYMYNNKNSNVMQSENDNIYKVGGVTPLHRACFSGATSTVRLLLDHIITITKNNSNSSNNTISSILSLPDTSFNDYQTPLHKCASGGRYLVVQLLLDFILEHDDTPSACALTLLLAKDAFGRTPLDLAREKQQQQNIERQSVQRWDTIAGGYADWNICVQLLATVQSKIKNKNLIQVASSNSSNYSLPKYIQQQLQQPQGHTAATTVSEVVPSVCIDIDCEDGRRQCMTSSWERAFQAALKGAVVARTTAATAMLITCTGTENNSVGTGNVATPVKSSFDPSRGESTEPLDHVITSETYPNSILPLVATETIPTRQSIGRPCSDCGMPSVVLIMQSRNNQNRMVCTKCRHR